MNEKKEKPENKKHSDEQKKVNMPAKEIEQLKEKAKSADVYLDNLIRLKAEFENFKKRSAREMEEFLKYANKELIYELLGTIDNFERALEAAEKKDDFKLLHQGVEMILKELRQLLKRRNVSRMDVLGTVFDPHRHEAIMYVNSGEHPENMVVEEVQRGYSWDGKVIRPAVVKVSKKGG